MADGVDKEGEIEVVEGALAKLGWVFAEVVNKDEFRV